MDQQVRPYQGFPYVNRAYTDAPSIPAQPTCEGPRPGSSRTAEQTGPERPTTLAVSPRNIPNQTKVLSQAERELRAKYGSSRSNEIESPYLDETIFYDPFENRRIPNYKDSPGGNTKSSTTSPITPQEDSDESDTDNTRISIDEPPTPDVIQHLYEKSRQTNIYGGPYANFAHQNSSFASSGQSSISTITNSGQYSSSISPNAGPSTTTTRDLLSPGYSTSSVGPSEAYYTKETSMYPSSPAEQLPTPIPIDQFPEPPPAYSEIDQRGPTTVHATPATSVAPPIAVMPVSPVAIAPVRTDVITVPTSQVTQDPAVLFHPSRKYVVCPHCNVQVLTIVRKEPGLTTHVIAAVLFVVCMPLIIFVYCTDYFKDSVHYCPNCDNFLHKEASMMSQGTILQRGEEPSTS